MIAIIRRSRHGQLRADAAVSALRTGSGPGGGLVARTALGPRAAAHAPLAEVTASSPSGPNCARSMISMRVPQGSVMYVMVLPLGAEQPLIAFVPETGLPDGYET